MRVTNKTQRIILEDERSLFQKEYEYYSKNNLYPVTLFGKNFYNMYRRINLQVLVTRKCNMHCTFCIEENEHCETEIDTVPILNDILYQYKQQGITPCLSITGGEPMLESNKVTRIVQIAKHLYYLDDININTNGTNANLLPSKILTNVSLHDTDYESLKALDTTFFLPVYYQCVMQQGKVDSIDRIVDYIDLIGNVTKCVGFSFRGLSTLNCKGIGYQNMKVDFFDIVNQISHDKRFEFVQQKIGDHYVYEIYRYKGYPIRFTYANRDLLREYEIEERKQGNIYSRANIITPDGNVYTGWNLDLNLLKKQDSI